MAKSKNHTNHNQGPKLHRNGIKKPKRLLHKDTHGMDRKYLRSLRRVRKGNVRAARMTPEEREQKKAAKKWMRVPSVEKEAARKAHRQEKAARRAAKQAEKAAAAKQ